MSIITRKRRDSFAIVPNAIANDERLTFEERGVLIYLLAKPDDWNVSVVDLQRRGGFGRDKAYRILQKLVTVGYIRRKQSKDASGRFTSYDYDVYDDAVPDELPLARPRPENQETASPLPDFPSTGLPLTGKCDSYKEQSLPRTESPLSPQMEGGDSFELLWSNWPKEHLPDSKDTALRAFLTLSAEERRMAMRAAEHYRKAMFNRGKPRLMIPFLRKRLFVDFHDAPVIDKDGDFVFKAGQPEWSAWLGVIRREHGEAAVQRAVAGGHLCRKTRWPEGYSLDQKVTKMATYESDLVTGKASAIAS